MDDIESGIATIIRKVTRKPELEIKPETELDTIGLESLDLVELVFMIEDEFGIDVPYNANTADGVQFTTVRSVAEAVRSIIGGRVATA